MGVFATDLGEPEGPVLLEDGSWLCVEMEPSRGCVTRLAPDGGAREVLAVTGRPNGLARDREGALWVAESRDPAILRMTLAGEVQVRLTEDGAGRPFVFPNDVAIGPDGSVYVTDSGMPHREFAPLGIMRPDAMEADYDGCVYRVDPATLAVERFDGGLRFANGIALGPDGRLYVNETVTGEVVRYAVGADGRLGPREPFANVRDPDGPPTWRGGDGMKFAADGTLWCTVYGQGDVTVLDPDGRVLRRLPTHGSQPTNVAFGPPGSGRLYVTEVQRGQLEVHEVGVDGLALLA